ncbi:hypothetical protein SAMD00023519_02251 [Listeria monocytogenes]|nr:hypothetical protein SAMD00023519_02251 [Listeria monocytogenes]
MEIHCLFCFICIQRHFFKPWNGDCIFFSTCILLFFPVPINGRMVYIQQIYFILE